MESLANVYSNLAFSSDIVSAGNLTHTAKVRKGTSRDFVPPDDASFGHTAATQDEKFFLTLLAGIRKGKLYQTQDTTHNSFTSMSMRW